VKAGKNAPDKVVAESAKVGGDPISVELK